MEVECESCNGQRFNEETLQIRYNGKNIYEVLELTIEEALNFFKHQPKIKRILSVLNDIGLGYIKLGQPSTTLSGGEAQRIKLGGRNFVNGAKDIPYMFWMNQVPVCTWQMLKDSFIHSILWWNKESFCFGDRTRSRHHKNG